MEPAIILHATLEKLGGRKHTTWQTRACTLDRDSLRWKSRGTGGHAIPLTDVESAHGGRADEAGSVLSRVSSQLLRCLDSATYMKTKNLRHILGKTFALVLG